MIDVERWAEIRRMQRVDGLSIREIQRRTGLHRKTIRRALLSDEPPVYRRAGSGSKLDPFKGWIEEQLAADARIPSKRLRELARELGYVGGKTIFDDFVREMRPRYLVKRTFQRTVYRPGELCQFGTGVLSIRKLGQGQADCYLEAVAQGIEDYYTGAGEVRGRSAGSSAPPR